MLAQGPQEEVSQVALWETQAGLWLAAGPALHWVCGRQATGTSHPGAGDLSPPVDIGRVPVPGLCAPPEEG